MTETPRHTPVLQTERNARHVASAAPYAGPARRSGARAFTSGGTATVPYIPAPFRGRPSVAPGQGTAAHEAVAPHDATDSGGVSNAQDVDLPWIDAFLDQEPAATEELAAGDTAERDAASLRDVPESDISAGPAADSHDSTWPIDEAGADLRRIGDTFGEPQVEASDDAPDALFDADAPAGASPAPMPMWTGDEWMDIMPVAPKDAQAADAERETVGDSGVEHAAHLLEALAEQVRSGELVLPGYSSTTGDAATLAAVLTALLGRGR